jgi:hypothetical protein
MWKKTISHLRGRQSIIIQLPSDSWIDKILSSIRDEQFDEWRQFNGIKYRIHTGQFHGTLPARHLLIGCGTRLGQFDVQIISEMKGASLRLRNIIKEAKKQLPDIEKGIIVIQTQYSDILSNIARKNLATNHYKNVVVLLE